jgi:hypothetical protein
MTSGPRTSITQQRGSAFIAASVCWTKVPQSGHLNSRWSSSPGCTSLPVWRAESKVRYTQRIMRWLRQLGAIALLLISCVAPVMACMRPDARMSAQERACCRMMKGQCGEMQMPASHECCHKTLQSAQQNALHGKTVELPPLSAIALPVAAYELSAPASAAANRIDRPQHSPPTSPPLSVSVLRI